MSVTEEERLQCLKEYILLRKNIGKIELEWRLVEDEIQEYERPTRENSICISINDTSKLCTILITYPLDISEIVLDFIKTELYTIVG